MVREKKKGAPTKSLVGVERERGVRRGEEKETLLARIGSSSFPSRSGCPEAYGPWKLSWSRGWPGSLPWTVGRHHAS